MGKPVPCFLVFNSSEFDNFKNYPYIKYLSKIDNPAESQ